MEYFHLTTPQQNIWNLQKYYEGTAIANLCGAIFFQEKRDEALLQEAIRQFIRSQTGIRLRFCEEGEPVQYVSEDAVFVADILVMEFLTREDFERYAEDFAKEPIGLTEEAMYRFVIFEVEDRSGVLVVLSHMVADAWTFGLMANWVDEAYRKLEAGENVLLEQADYIEFVQSEKAYFNSERYQKDRMYWENKYLLQPEESLVKLCPIPPASIISNRITNVLPIELERKIAAFCNKNPVTPAVLFETALVIYLSKVNGKNHDITIGIPVLNRSNPKEKSIAGMFISMMPLTVTVDKSMLIFDLTRQITLEHMQIFRHQKYPYASILRTIRKKRNCSGNIYNTIISYQNARTQTEAETKWYSNGYSEIPLEIHIDNRDGNDRHTINIDYQIELFSKTEVLYFFERYKYIIQQIVEENNKSINDICIIPKHEFENIIIGFNDTARDYPRDKCVHELFAEQASRMPNNTALIFEDKKFTYKKLDEMSNSLAHYLREKGIGRGDVVPIIAKRSWHIIVAMLGILKAGGAYMPVDPNYPEERIEYMLQMANSKMGVQYGCINHKKGLDFLDLGKLTYDCNVMPILVESHSSDLCYVIFTSGSTGKPKGVSICHRNISNFVCENDLNVCNAIVQEDCKTFISIANPTFDMFTTETLLSLTNGLTICLANEEEILSQEKISKLFVQYQIDVLQTTPTKLRLLMSKHNNLNYLETLKAVILGGEEVSIEVYKEISSRTPARIYNNYGPTETTVWSSIKQVNSTDITIGKPIANTQIYIVDSYNNLLPIGVAGELCIAGDGVGQGYLNRPELTAERFVPNPFATKKNGHGRTMYRTGDLARWRADGEIEYLGRIDTQVKIRGLRIELGEIESVMASFPKIVLCAAIDKKDETGRQYLVVYYTTSEDVLIDEKELREYLTVKLPKYMVPNYFMRLETIPMTASGKIDRKSLPVPDFAQPARKYVPPVTSKEKELCHLMEELLHVEQVGVADDFFELGGDSLTAIEFLAKAHDSGIVFALQNIFDYPTVRQLCDHLEGGDETKIHYAPADFDKYQSRLAENVIDEAFVPKKKSLGNVLLTGATGFLGAHMLERLVKEEIGKVYCLVRDGEKAGNSERLREILRYYFGERYEEEFAYRIIPIAGDIESEALAENMPKDVQTVIHTAASVKHYGSYDYFNRVNVEGTRHVVNYAKAVGARLIHISTLSVSGNSLADEFAVYRSEEEKFFGETSLYIGQPLDNVYIHSKFEAERAVFDAMLEGLDAKIIRVGNLTSRALDYKFQPNYKQNAFLMRVKAILEFGLFPDYLMHLYSEFSPIDLTAEGVVKIAQYAGSQTVFHLNSNRPIYFDRFLEVVRELGISMKVVDGDSFTQALRGTIRDRGTEYIFEAFQNDMDDRGRLMYDSNIHIENDFTVWFLKKLGFEWNEIDMEYIRGYVGYFRGIGYLEV